jgi:hypothetical protein
MLDYHAVVMYVFGVCFVDVLLYSFVLCVALRRVSVEAYRISWRRSPSIYIYTVAYLRHARTVTSKHAPSITQQ